MQALPIIHFFCFAAYLYFSGFVILVDPRGRLNQTGSLIFASMAVWSFSSFIVTSGSFSRQTSVLFLNIGSAGWIMMPAVGLWFFLELNGKTKLLQSNLLRLSLFLASLLFLVLQINNTAIIALGPKYQWGWRFEYPVSLFGYVFYIYCFLCVGYGILITFLNWRSISGGVDKGKFFLLYFYGISVLILCFISDLIIPLFGSDAIPNFLSNIIMMVWHIVLVYVANKYRLFVLTPFSATKEIVSTMVDPLFLVSPDGEIRWTNSSAQTVLGFNENELTGKPIQEIICDIETILDFKNPKEIRDLELYLRVKNSQTLPASLSISPMYDRSKQVLTGIVFVCRDITDRKNAETILKTSLKEKETLLREIHHRVKNNMQIVVSMLRLSARRSRNEEVNQILKTTQGRIETMSLIHNVLYRSDTFSEVILKNYFEEIGAAIFMLFNITRNDISLDIEGDTTMLPMDLAIPCGLIFNELVFNSIIHAFPDQAEKCINVTINRNINSEVQFRYRDNGIGIPEHIKLDQTDTLGLSIINLLAKNQLQGTIKMEHDAGARFTISFNQHG